MSRKRARLTALAAALFAAEASVAHDTGVPSIAAPSITTTFAGCVGRLSAEMEHAWLFVDRPSESIARQRANMIELLDLVDEGYTGREILAMRIDAKAAHARLLTRAAFNDDASDAAWALRRAEAQISACKSLLLS